MAVQTLAYFKAKFIDGYTITEDDMQDWLDSFRHVSVAVPLGDTTGLETTLANYRLKSDAIATGDIANLTSFITDLLAGYVSTSTELPQSQITGLVDALAEKATLQDVQDAVEAATDGLSSGTDGVTPHIGENGNWFVGETDTGVAASVTVTVISIVTAKNEELEGARDGGNNTLRLPDGKTFKAGTLRIYRDGIRLDSGGSNDFVETDDRRGATFNRIPNTDNKFQFDYEPEL